MKKHLSFMTEDRGFIFFHVMFIITLSLIIIITSIEIYRNNLLIIERQTEHVHYETLFQMGRTELINELLHSGLPSEPLSFHFPIGTVSINLLSIDMDTATFQFVISFHETPAVDYVIHHPLPIPPGDI